MQHPTPQHNEKSPRDDVAAIVSALGERYVLDILDAAADVPRSAKEIARIGDVPTTTLYRRLDDLVDVGLVEETMELDESGDHYHVYHATLDSLSLSRGEEGMEIDVDISAEETSERLESSVSRLRDQT